MTAEIVNLRRARKSVALKTRQATAAENREKFGETRQAKTLRGAREALASRTLAGKALGRTPQDGDDI